MTFPRQLPSDVLNASTLPPAEPLGSPTLEPSSQEAVAVLELLARGVLEQGDEGVPCRKGNEEQRQHVEKYILWLR